MHRTRAILVAALLPAGLLWSSFSAAQIGVGVSVDLPGIELRADTAPPPLPVYDQPPVPDPDYIWTPGYWSWSDNGYYWVPGTWVEPPSVGLLWTPGYWGWENGAYLFRGGYWGPQVGFYGGVNYGFGYGGVGFEGGRWVDNHFAYNTAVTHVNNEVIHNTYNQTVINRGGSRVSFNGPEGVHATPTREQLAAASQRHIPATAAQQQHVHQAAQNVSLRAATNHGRPPIAATPRPGAYSGAGVSAAHASTPRAAPRAATNTRVAPTAPAERTQPGRAAATERTPMRPTEHAAAAARPEAPRPEGRPAAAPARAEHAAAPARAAPHPEAEHREER